MTCNLLDRNLLHRNLLDRTRPSRSTLTALLAVLLLAATPACGDDSDGAGGAGGSGAGGSGAEGGAGGAPSATGSTASSDATGSTASTASGEGGDGSGGAPVCDLPSIDLAVDVELPDGTVLHDDSGDGEVEHTVFGYVERDSDTSFHVEHATNGEVTTVTLSGATVPEELPYDLEYGVDVELRVAWFGDEEYEVASLHFELLDAEEGRVLFAGFSGEPRSVEGAQVGLDLLDETCSVPLGDSDSKRQNVPVRITADGASVDVAGGETAALGDTPLVVEHQGTIVNLTPEPTAATGIIIRPAD
jgi:hypothetical protein